MRLRDFVSALFGRSQREEFLAHYIIRECRKGRSLESVLDDPYVRNRSTPAERERLLDRPDVVAAIGESAARELRLTLAQSRG